MTNYLQLVALKQLHVALIKEFLKQSVLHLGTKNFLMLLKGRFVFVLKDRYLKSLSFVLLVIPEFVPISRELY